MERDKVELVRRFFDVFYAFDQEAFESIVADIDPAVEIDWSESNAPYAGNYSGLQGWQRLFDEIRASFQDGWFEAHEYRVEGPHVAVQNTAHLRGRNGIEVKARSTIVFTFRNDKVSMLRLYQDDAAARAAVRAAGD